MTRTRLAMGIAAALAASAAVLLGGLFRSGTAASAPAAPAAADRLAGGFGAGDTAALVTSLQRTLRANPKDVHSYDLLGLAYEQRARETGDPAYYPRADGVLHRALALAPRDVLAVSGLGSLALSRHRFRDALKLGERARKLSPTTARTYGVIGDALVELGRYDAAFRAFDTMASLKPSLASYARVSYADELLGDTAGARSAMNLARDAAIGEAEPAAWTEVQLGKLEFAHGHLSAAGRHDRAALVLLPGYVHGLDALAQVEGAQGRYAHAIALERQAVAQIPLPQFVGTLAGLYRVTGHSAAAHRQVALVGAIEQLLRANGVRTDLETALFDVDHGVRLHAALALARRAQRERPSIDGDDV